MPKELRLFAYGSLLRGEEHAGYLTDAIRLGPSKTAAGYRLVELDRFPAMIESGTTCVVGEVYEVTPEQLRRIDELKENGRLFERREIELADGVHAMAYLMDEEKLRGRRRLPTGDWRARFAPRSRLTRS